MKGGAPFKLAWEDQWSLSAQQTPGATRIVSASLLKGPSAGSPLARYVARMAGPRNPKNHSLAQDHALTASTATSSTQNATTTALEMSANLAMVPAVRMALIRW